MRQLEKEKQKKEHILVCLSSSPSNEKIIRTAAQMAQAFQAGFTALYVQTAEKTEKTPEDLARLQKHVRLAEQSGAEIVTTHSEDIADCRVRKNFRGDADCHWKEHDEAGLFPSAKGVDRASDGSCA